MIHARKSKLSAAERWIRTNLAMRILGIFGTQKRLARTAASSKGQHLMYIICHEIEFPKERNNENKSKWSFGGGNTGRWKKIEEG